MKDFVKWLGVNEKVAKVAVWILIFMVFLIVTNTMLESTGFPYYKITYNNISKIKFNLIMQYLFSAVIAILNFYSIVLLVFKVKESKRILKYSLLYLLINIVISLFAKDIVIQVVIFAYIICFCYFFSGKNWRYIMYGTLAYVMTVFVQGVWYLSKARFIDYSKLTSITKSILSLDYFIIMAVIILVKEIYVKKRGEKDGRRKRSTKMRVLDRRLQERRSSSKENSKKSS